MLQLSEFLNHDDRHKIYAVEQLTRLKINTPDLVNKVCTRQIKNKNLWSSLQVNYLQTLPDSLFVDAVLSILKDGNSTQQTAMLSDLLQSSSVITSYSIHYTKLYDSSFPNFCKRTLQSACLKKGKGYSIDSKWLPE